MGFFIGDAMQLCTHIHFFSLRRQMAPVQSIKFQTANFPIFCARIIVIFEQRV